MDERTFSKLIGKKKTSTYRSSSPQGNLTNLMDLCPVSNVLDVVKINEIIEKFAFKMATKKFTCKIFFVFKYK